MHKRFQLTALFALLFAAASARATDVLHGIGLMGDSATDEYQFYTADPANRSFARNWVEILQATRGLNFGSYSLVDRGSPRHQGFEYNWARTRTAAAATFTLGPGADFQNIMDLGQPFGLAGQVATGDVTLTAMLVGNNDFLQYFVDPNAPVPSPAVFTNQVTAMTTNAITAASIVLGANPNAKMVLFTIPDEKWSPAAQGAAANAVAHGVPQAAVDALFGGISAATQGYNAQLIAFAQASGGRVALADLYGLLETIEADARNPGNPQPLIIDGITMDLDIPGHSPNNFWLDDGIHPSTLAQGLIANLFINTVNAANWGSSITPLSQNQIGSYAASVPEPATLACVALAAPALLLRRRKPH